MQKQKWYKKMLTIILIVVNVTLYPKDIIISYAKENIGDVCEIQDESDINLHDVYATNTTISSEQIKNYFLSKVGQSVSQASCLAFIADGFQQLGATRSSANCAYEYGSSHICSTSMDNIPVGADVFFLWNQDYYKGTWYICEGGHYCHHIGVYVGDGYVVHTSGGKVVKTALSTLVTKGGTGWNMDFRGWGYHGNVTIGGDPTTPTNIFSSLSTSDISETNAQINAELTNTSYVTTGGFYISKNADMSGSSKITENLNKDVKTLWYGMNKWYGTLSSGTTYYWQMYAVIGGTEYKSSVQSFTTTVKQYNLFIDPNGGAFSDGRTTVVTASPQLIYHGWNWNDISGHTPTRAGYALSGYFTASSGGTKVYKADGSICYDGSYWTGNGYSYQGDLTVYAQWEDVTKPTITNARIENITPDGYDVICTATDNAQVERVAFATWWNGTYDQVWEDGIKNGDTYTHHVDVSKHNNKRNVMYITDILAYDSAGNYSIFSSLYASVPSNESIIRFDASGGTIALDTITVTYGTDSNSDVSWLNPTKEGCRFKGWYTDSGYQVYDAKGFCINDNIYWSNNAYLKYEDLVLYAQWEDVTKPTITNARIENITPDGYDVICTATDNVQVEKVTFATWWNGTYDQVWEDGIKNGDTYTHHIDVSKHNNKRNVIYITDILAYDSAGNYSIFSSLYASVPSNESIIRFDASGGTIALDTITVTYGTDSNSDVSWLNPTKAGYRFKGWYTDSGYQVYNAKGFCINDNIYWSNNAYLKYEDLTLYAQWEFVADVTPPVISNVTVTNLSGAGYTLTATVQDDIGISYVTFPTRRLNTGDNEWKWKNGTLNADGTYSVYIDMADYEYIDYTYETRVYAYDTSGNMSSVYPISQYVDTTPPVISDVYVTDITADGYTVHCTVNDNNSIDNIQCVKFPTWTLYNGQDDINPTWWHVDSLAMAGTRNGNEYTYRVNISDHNNEEGTYITHIYAFDKFGNRSIAKEAEVIIDNTNPVISNVKVFNISPDGYSVICTAEDNIGIAKVQFPTWTNNNGQDDLLEEWWLNPLYEGKKLGNSYRYDVSIEDHNFESGTYITHIYAYDLCNNYVQYRIPQIEVPENVGFRISVIPEQTYTGQPIKPSFRVYDDSKIMVEGVDYTVSYRNNTNVAKLSDAKAPTVVVTGKGNYSGKISQQFTINPRSVADANVQVSLKDLLATGKVQKPVPTISYSGKKLTARKDFEIYYPDEETEGAYQNPGTWRVLIKGINNFSGEREVKFTIAESIALSKTKVGAVPNQTYTGQPIKPELKITIGTDELIEGTDYTLEYQNNILPGKATITIHGIGKYLGTKTINFTILGTSLAKAQVSGIANKVYNGTLQTQNMTVILGDKVLVEDVDYKVGYQKNLNVGTANIVITGMGGYTGTIKKSFKITPYDIQLDADRQITGIPGSDFTIEYTKGGCTPDINVFFRGFRMDTKKDITVTYSNNTKLGTAEDVKAPTITIKGKGNFTGSVVVPFNIVEKNIGTQDNPVKITVPDVVAVNKPGKYVSIPSLVDSNGKKLVAGTDYNKTIVYTLDDGTVLDKNSIVPAGREITVTITGKGCYSGTVKATYRVTKESVNSAKVTVKNKTYTGKNVTLSEDDISVVVNKRTLIYGVDYEIVEDSYKGNVAKGNATVSIKGKGNYGGMKTVKFTIAAKNIY